MDKIEACGIEVSAQELVVAMSGRREKRCVRDSRTPLSGTGSCCKLSPAGGSRVRACLEATGVYGLDVALFLSAQAGIELMVANPRAVRHFAQARISGARTIGWMPVMLREFAMRMEFTAWTRPEQSTLALWAIAGGWQALTRLCTAEKNRQHAAGVSQACPRVCEPAWRGRYGCCSARSRNCAKQRGSVSRAMPGLQRRYQLLRTVPGIGEISAIQILAELALLPTDRDVRQWVAYAGLDPHKAIPLF